VIAVFLTQAAQRSDLHDTAHLSQPAWNALRDHYEEPRLLEFLVPAGWYRTISFLANGLLLAA
jgi:hypothetical protein